MSNHKLFLILGETSSGKDFLTNRICSELGLRQLISYTTRPRRAGEGDTHVFVDDSVYEQMAQEGNIAAYTKIGEYHYWATVKQLYESDVYIIDRQGMQYLESLCLADLDLCSIYINVPLEVRMQRALDRGDDTLMLMSRVQAETEQFLKLKAHAGFDYAVSNLNSEKAFEVIEKIIEVETTQN